MNRKNRDQKAEEYYQKYSEIPVDYDQRLAWMVERSHLSPQRMDEIIDKMRNMQSYLQYYNFKVVLFENPEGAKRPRFRLVNRKNYANLALQASNFVHVYSPNAAEDNKFIHRLVDQELIQLNQFIQTPCQVLINIYSKTPSYFNAGDTILAEIGLHRPIQKPDWDNYGKKYTDMFNSNIWLDDNLVMDGQVHKYYSILPRVEIFIQYLNCVTNVQHYNQIIGRKDYREDYPIAYMDKNGFIIGG